MSKNDEEIKINKGVELMLRREKPAPERRGAILEHTFNLLKRKFQLKFEFTWEVPNK
jgi:hypothetical protein